VVISTYSAGPIAEIGLQPHQGAVTGLLQWLQLYSSSYRVNRTREVTRSGSVRTEQVAELDALTLQLIPDLVHPVVVTPRTKRTAILDDRTHRVTDHLINVIVTSRCLRRRPGRSEIYDVNPAPIGLVPAQVGRCHDE
jgi:hypothetical protein